MTNTYTFKNIKSTRKLHTCALCLRKIPKGFSARFHTGISDEGFFNYYTCNTCTKLLEEWQELFVDEDLNIREDYLSDLMSDYNCHTPHQLLKRLENESFDSKSGELPEGNCAR